LWGDEVYYHLLEINDYLKWFKEEVVIMDFQHFYGFNKVHHDLLLDYLKEVFGEKICPYEPNLDITDVTLDWMRSRHFQVIIIYRDWQIENQHIPELWPGK
jgi:hypothetical protein